MRWPVVILAVLAGCAQEQGAQQERGISATCEGITDPGFVWVDGGEFTLGEDAYYPEEGPARLVEIDGYWISQTEVTNAQFAQFVEETGFLTAAEKAPPAIEGAPPEMLQPGSAVFRAPTPDDRNWWAWVPGANWREPSGPGSSIAGRENDPVVQVTFDDALAYAEWAGVSLPTEEQWEYAARAGSEALPEPKDAAGLPTANYYQGVFPARDTGADGYLSRAPVGCFDPNAFGLHDMIGNVWEWTLANGRSGSSTKTIKGGSYLCAANYCARYRPAARQYQERDLGTDHIGFRVVDSSRAPPSSP